MIIFNLDGTLANCEHRRHFVDVTKNDNYKSYLRAYDDEKDRYDGYHKITNEKWKPDWPSFYEACDKDEPIRQTFTILNNLLMNDEDIQIWSRRCESVRKKTEKWLRDWLEIDQWFYRDCLKMRPIGNTVPDEQLKEQWLDDWIARGGNPIEMVFESNPKSIQMWKRRGIFVFNCQQSNGEF